MGGCALDVRADALDNVCGLFVANVLRVLCGNAHYQATGRELPVLRYQGAGGDDGTLTYLRTVQDDRPHAYKATVSYLATVHDRFMADTQSSPTIAG